MARPLKFKSVDELQKLIDKYFADCKANDEPLTITGLALALDTTRDVLIDYENSNFGDELKEKEKELLASLSNAIKKAKLQVEHYAELQVFKAKNPAGSIFVLKNHGWKDKQETDINLKGEVEIIVKRPTE